LFQVFIVGKPNVGKSTLFNKLIKQRKAIVDNQPGVTRDAVYGEIRLDEHRVFRLVDTCGIFQEPEGIIETVMKERTQRSLKNADLILFIVDGQTQPTSEDFEIADMLRAIGKPVLFVANKTESSKRYDDVYPELFALGFGEPIAVSAEHKIGTSGLVEEIENIMNRYEEQEDTIAEEPERSDDIIKITIMGKPNVGKSMLLNALSGKERALVTAIPGTTRDPIDEIITRGKQSYLLIDSAGIRKRTKVDYKSLESFSISRAQQAMKASDIVLLLMDIREPVSEQDQRIAGMIEEEGKASVIVFNKIDLLSDSNNPAKFISVKESALETLYFIYYSPVIFVSALKMQNLEDIFKAIDDSYRSYTKTFTTGEINRALERVKLILPPPSYNGKPVNMYYATQVAAKPPIISIFVNDPKAVPANYKTAVKRQLRKLLDPLSGSPLFLKFVPRRDH
jgi:GTP-binding protein